MSLSASFLSVVLFQNATARAAQESERAHAAAESGADRALFEVQLAADFDGDGIGNSSGSVGRIPYAASIDPAFAGLGEYTLRSVASVNVLRRGIELVVGPEIFKRGFFGIDGVDLASGVIDSYDSGLGSYANQVGPLGYASDAVSVGSNGDIRLTGNAHIYGDATPGPAGAVTGNPGNVTGSTSPAEKTRILEPFTYAPPIASSGSLNSTTTLGSGVFRYSQINLSSSKTLTLIGDVELYVDGDISLSGSSQIIISPGANVAVYHGSGDMKIAGQGVLNQDKLPSALTIQSATNGDIDFSGGSDFYGTVYAPEADLKSSGGSDFFGAVEAKSITVTGGGFLHCDSSLDELVGDRFVVRMARPFSP
jgi:hypothetical protein